jgi:hypothetical protein
MKIRRRPDAWYLGLAAMRTVFRPDASWLLASAGTRRRIKAAATRAEVRVEELTSLSSHLTTEEALRGLC